jgi:hypothetical protein
MVARFRAQIALNLARSSAKISSVRRLYPDAAGWLVGEGNFMRPSVARDPGIGNGFCGKTAENRPVPQLHLLDQLCPTAAGRNSPIPDGTLAFDQSLRTENQALAEFKRVLVNLQRSCESWQDSGS